MAIEVFAKQRNVKISPKWVKRILNQVLRSEGAKGELSIVFVEDSEIAELNRRYRNKKRPTDVLAFPALNSPAEIPVLGDIVICAPIAAKQAKTQRHSVYHEIAFLLIHGTLHLLEYDHRKPRERKIMFQKQDTYWKRAVARATRNSRA